MSEIEEAARELVQARRVLSEAKSALRRYREAHGCCEIDEAYPCYARAKTAQAIGDNTLIEQCEVCKGSNALYQVRSRAAVRVGKALRRLTYLCRKSASQQASKDVK